MASRKEQHVKIMARIHEIVYFIWGINADSFLSQKNTKMNKKYVLLPSWLVEQGEFRTVYGSSIGFIRFRTTLRATCVRNGRRMRATWPYNADGRHGIACLSMITRFDKQNDYRRTARRAITRNLVNRSTTVGTDTQYNKYTTDRSNEVSALRSTDV